MKKLVALFGAIVLVCLSVPAMAVNWHFSGSARMATFWVSDDPKDTGNKDADLQWELQSNSRIGAKVRAESLSGRFELGLQGTDGSDGNVTTRKIYGGWDFGSGKLKVGKDYGPAHQFVSGQVFDLDDDGLGDDGLLGHVFTR